MPVAHELLSAAIAAADAADGASMGQFSSRGVPSAKKADGSAVTSADLRVEDAIRSTLERLTPGVPILAEEATTSTADPARPPEGCGPYGGACWVVDPIDGTENFSRGTPVWATLLALRTEGIGSLAVISAPVLGQRWSAATGQGAFAGEQRLHVSRHTSRANATLAYGGLHELPSVSARASLLRAAAQFRCAWGWGNFWGHVLVAQGAVDAALSHGTEIWDTIAPALVVSEAGGRWSDVKGRAALDSGSLVTSNGLLHTALVEDLSALDAAKWSEEGVR